MFPKRKHPAVFIYYRTHLLERLVDGHGPHGDGAVPHDPLPGLVDVLARAEVHEGVAPPERAPLQLLHLLLDAARDGAVPDVGVDLHLEHPPDDLGLQLEVPLVGADDGPAPGNLAAHELRVGPLARGHVGHLLGDEALPGEVHLGVPLVLPLAVGHPRRPDLREALPRVHVPGARRVVQVQVR